MEAPEGPPRFSCPPEFSASLFRPGGPFCRETLQGPAKELWLIRAPASFSPESLDGHSISLRDSQSLKASQPGGTEKIFHVQTALEHHNGARLLLPPDHGDHLTCSPPFSGSLSICERYGDPSSNQPLFTLAARPPPQIPGGLKQRFLPFGNRPGRAEEEPPKKKRKKKPRLGEEHPEDQLPPLGETTGAVEAETSGQHEVGGATPLETGSQPGSGDVAQNRILSGGPEDLAALSKKKKKRKEDRGKEVVGGEAEARPWHEDGAAALPVDSQTSCVADAPNRPLPGEAEELSPRTKKKKKKRKEGRELGEAEPASPQQVDGTVPNPQPEPTAVAQEGLLSGGAEDPAASHKKKKKKRKEDREVEEAGMEAEATHLQEENGTTPRRISPQPSCRLMAQDCLLSSEAEDPASIGKKKKKKKKRKEGQEGKEKMEGEAEGLLDLGSWQGAHSEPQAGENSLPGMDAHEEESSKEKAMSPELFSSQEDAAERLWDFSTPEGVRGLDKENPAVGSSSHKAKRKKEKPAQELKEWPAQQGAEGPAELGTPLGGGGGQVEGPGREELSQKRKKKERHRLEEDVGSSWVQEH